MTNNRSDNRVIIYNVGVWNHQNSTVFISFMYARYKQVFTERLAFTSQIHNMKTMIPSSVLNTDFSNFKIK